MTSTKNLGLTMFSHVGLGVKCAKEVATAIRGAIIIAKLSIVPVRRGYWGSHIAEPHTVPCKVSGKSGSVMCRLIPAPRGTGIVAAPASKRMLQMAGIQDCYSEFNSTTNIPIRSNLIFHSPIERLNCHPGQFLEGHHGSSFQDLSGKRN